jgi:hypothetical protein
MSRANIQSETQGLAGQDVYQRTFVCQSHWLPTAPDDRRCTVAEKNSRLILESGE